MANFAVNFGIGLGLQLFSAALEPPQTIGKLENKSLPDASYGSLIERGYGLVPFRGILTHLPDELTETKNKRGKIGGKVVEFSYSATMEFIVHDGVIVGIPYLTLNGDSFINQFTADADMLKSSQLAQDQITLRLGTENQNPVGVLEAISPYSVAPPNRGKAFITFPDWPLTEKLGNRPPLVQGVLATTGNFQQIKFSEDLQQPIAWVAPQINDVDIRTVSRFTTEQSTTFPLPAQYRLIIAGVDPEIRLNDSDYFTLKYNKFTNTWTHLNNEVLAMSRDLFDLGVFIELEVDEDQLTYRINGDVVDQFDLNATELTIKVTSDNWAGIESSDAQVQINRFVPEHVPLKSILKSICNEIEVECNVSEIDDLVRGVTLTGETPADWIAQLQSIYAFLVVDRGNTLYFLDGNRPGSVIRRAELSDFGLAESDLYQIEQKLISEIPYQCEVRYYDINDHQDKTVYYRFDTHDERDRPLSETVISIDTSAVMTADEALGIAELTLVRARNEREMISLSTSFDFYDLEPGDLLQIPLYNQQIQFLVIESSIGANFQVNLKLLRYSRDAWRAKRTPRQITPVKVTQSAAQFSRLYLNQNLPKLRASHPDNPVYLAISHQIPKYRTASAIASIDDGNSYQQAIEQNAQAVIGMSALLTNTGDELIVRVSGQLSTITEQTYNNNRAINRLAIGNEIIQFQTAALLGENHGWYYYRLTTIRRAQLGTTSGNHGLWSPVALASDLQPVASDDIGVSGTSVQFNILTDNVVQPFEDATLTL